MLRNLGGGSDWTSFWTLGVLQNAYNDPKDDETSKGDSSQTTRLKIKMKRSVRDGWRYEYLWQLPWAPQMKDKLLAGFMTCCVRFRKCEDVTKLEGL